MKSVSERLAKSLQVLKQYQDHGVVAIKSKMLERVDRERLIKHGFIKEVLRGWYILSSPDEQRGDSTLWYTSYWQFCAAYLTDRLGEQWCVSPEQSLNLHIGDATVPTQLLVRSPKGRNQPTSFIHDTSVFDLRLALPDDSYLTTIEGVNLYSLPAALVHCAPSHFSQQPIQVRTALSMIPDASEVLVVLIAGGFITAASRLAGAFRNIGRTLIADNIIKGMNAADYKVKEIDPFVSEPAVVFGRRELSPHVNRIRLMWLQMRPVVIQHFPETVAGNVNADQYLKEIEENYAADAYHSLSIEGYKVTHELIELVRTGEWNPDQSTENQKHVDAMAAKGYWDAFVAVKNSIARVLNRENPGEILEQEHSDWYLALFAPSVSAGIVKQEDLAGYRIGAVFIRKSMHTPPRREAIREMMPALFDLLTEEENPAVRVVLGHFIFVYIHPYFDGNGRMGRFIMNLMLAAGCYPWLIVPVERREEYMQALEIASVKGDIKPFSLFLASIMSDAIYYRRKHS